MHLNQNTRLKKQFFILSLSFNELFFETNYDNLTKAFNSFKNAFILIE